MGFDKREAGKPYARQEGDTLEAIAERETAAGNEITWEQLARFNWGTSDREQVNELLRDELGCRKRDGDNNFVIATDDTGTGELIIPVAFAKAGLATDKTHILRVKRKSCPEQFIECCKIPGVTFEFDKSFIRPNVVDHLKALEEVVGKHPDAKIMVFGHTDTVGSDEYNKALSERRAESAYAFVTNDADAWEDLYNHPNEKWGLRVVQIILADLGHDPGPIDGVMGSQTKAAMKSFDPSATTNNAAFRKKLFKAYMTSKHDVKVTADQFMDPKHMGCGEFNPIDAVKGKHEPNRRVTFYLFHKDRLPVLPCEHGVLAPCRKQMTPAEPRHHKPFKCSFYDSIAKNCKCEVGPPPAKPTVKLVKIETSDPVKGGAAPVWHADDDFSPRLNERAKVHVKLDKLGSSFTGKLRLDFGRLTNRADDPATKDKNESFTQVARVEVDVKAAKNSAVIEVEWDGKATVAVAQEFSNNQTRDNNAGANVDIPMAAINSGDPVTHGLYVIDQITLLQAGSEVAIERPTDADLSVPILVNLSFNANWTTDLAAYGLAPFQTQLESALRRFGDRDYQVRAANVRNRINARYISDTTINNSNSMLVSVGGNRGWGFGSTPNGPAPLSDNIYAFHDGLGSTITAFPGMFMMFNQAASAIGPTDQAVFQAAFQPLGVGAAANQAAPGVASPRAVAAGAVTGRCTAADSGAVTVVVSNVGMATVTTTNPPVVPAARAAAIQRAMRTFVRMVGNTTNHEVAHALGVASRVRANNKITISGTTVTSPLNGDGGAHNQVTNATNIVDSGGTRSFARRVESTGVQQVFSAVNLPYLRNCIPFDRKDN